MPQILSGVAQDKGVSRRGRGTPGHRQRIRLDVWEVELGDRAEPCKSKDAVGQETVNDADRIQYASASQMENLGCDWSGPASDAGIEGFDVEFGGETDEQVKDGDMSAKSENVTAWEPLQAS